MFPWKWKTGEVAYAWLKEGKWIVGENSESLALEDLKTTDAGAYSVSGDVRRCVRGE